MKKCKWCHELITSEGLNDHEENCDLNDGGRADMNYEMIEEKYL